VAVFNPGVFSILARGIIGLEVNFMAATALLLYLPATEGRLSFRSGQVVNPVLTNAPTGELALNNKERDAL
jgi:hypothetical protein